MKRISVVETSEIWIFHLTYIFLAGSPTGFRRSVPRNTGKGGLPLITMKGIWKSMLLSCILCSAQNENHTLCQERWSWKQLRDLVGTNPDIHHQRAILYETNGYNSDATDKRTLSRAAALINSVKMFYTHMRHEVFPLNGSEEDHIRPRAPLSPPQFWLCVGHLEAV